MTRECDPFLGESTLLGESARPWVRLPAACLPSMSRLTMIVSVKFAERRPMENEEQVILACAIRPEVSGKR